MGEIRDSPLTAAEVAMGRIVRVAACLAFGGFVGGLLGAAAGVFFADPVPRAAGTGPVNQFWSVLLYGAEPGALVGVVTAGLFCCSAGARRIAASVGWRAGRVLGSALDDRPAP